MRIVGISNSRVPSTTANSIQAMKVCDALSQLGHDVHLLVPAEAPAAPWEDLSRHYGIAHRFDIDWLPSRPRLRRADFVLHAYRTARGLAPDLVYTWLPQSAALESWMGHSVVLEMHADVAGRFGAWWVRRFWNGRGRSAMLVTTHALRRALERSTRSTFPAERVMAAGNGIDLDRYAALPKPSAARKELGLPEGPTAGFTGHLYAGRGAPLLFEIGLKMPHINFLWVGGSAEAVSEWRGKLDASRIRNVTLTGFVENSRLPLYQAACDMLLMPYASRISASSGQEISEVINPMKMYEYMASCRPIITADLPVIREMLDESRAVFCPPGDVTVWCQAIQALAEDGERASSLAENAWRKVQAFTWTARQQKALAMLSG
jgi:glycosyltransferase involved in cell wall biosynthesis